MIHASEIHSRASLAEGGLTQEDVLADAAALVSGSDSFDRAKTGSAKPRGFLLWHLWLPLGLFASLLVLFESTGLDLWLSDLFFDFQKGVFFWKNTWWATSLIHTGGKILVACIWVCLVFLLFIPFLKSGYSRLRSWRGALGFLMLSMILGPATVACGKLLVNRPYPEHIKRYGGPLEYTRLFQGPPPTHRHYKGFPAGHASGGYGLMALYFVLLERRPRLAPWGLAFVVVLGSLFGFGQHVRGLHYASHNLWSAAICWFEALFLYLGLFRGKLASKNSCNSTGEPTPQALGAWPEAVRGEKRPANG